MTAIDVAMNVALRSEKLTKVRSRATSRQRPWSWSGWSAGAWTRVTMSRYPTNVAALTAKRTVKLDGCATEAMSPATTPPIATPRFITRRCSAYAPARRPGGASAARSADCAGQKEPLPAPQTMYSAKACHATRISGMSANATVITHSAAMSTRFGPIRSERVPARKPLRSALADCVAAASPASPSEMPRTLCR